MQNVVFFYYKLNMNLLHHTYACDKWFSFMQFFLQLFQFLIKYIWVRERDALLLSSPSEEFMQIIMEVFFVEYMCGDFYDWEKGILKENFKL